MNPTDIEILCVGEVVWDQFPEGARLGGAPLNVAANLAEEGIPVGLFTAVGQDALGCKTLALLEAHGLPGPAFHPELPTGTVEVAVDAQGVPAFQIRQPAAWMDLEGAFPPGQPLQAWRASPAVIVFGGVAMHSAGNRSFLDRVVREARSTGAREPLLLCDLNLRPGLMDPLVVRWCLERAQVLKVNEEERAFLETMEGLDRGQALLDALDLAALCTTLGPCGQQWEGRGGQVCALPALKVSEGAPTLVDTVGAGDSVTAAIALGLARGEAPLDFLDRARYWAARICGVQGGLPGGWSGALSVGRS